MTAAAAALHLARRLTALPEPEMRQRVLIEYLEGNDLAEAVQVIHEIYSKGRQGGPPYDIALLTIAATLSGGVLGYELESQIYLAAKAAELTTVSRLMLSDQENARDEARVDEDLELTLGHRKWMARSTDRNVLQRLMRFPEAEVIRNLLENPRITEKDVVFLAARRPAKVEVQQTIFNSRKWLARYAVKRALILNPYTPTDLGLRLVSFLKQQDLRMLHSSPAVPTPLREAAAQLLERDSV
jgi:hypothetical protein